MKSRSWDRLIRQRLDALAERHAHRSLRVARPLDATHVEIDGRRYVNFASNNYLGLSHHPRVLEAAAAAMRREGVGSGASPLVTGRGPAHESAERRIAAWKGTEAAVLLPSGYQANIAAVQTLAALWAEQPVPAAREAAGGRVEAASGRGGVRFLLDKLVHASLIDAVRSSGAPFRVLPHNGLHKLARLLDEAQFLDAPPCQTQIVVTESVFSMDGDEAELRGLADFRRGRHRFILLLDEAHASGVYGPAGAGLAAHQGLNALPDVSVVTLSKAMGCAGGAICGTKAFCEAVVNLGRAYIYSTAVPAALAGAAEAAIDVLHDEPQHQRRLRDVRLRVAEALRNAGLFVPPSFSAILPVFLGSEEAALEAASRLQQAGLWVVAIRPPTVPRGTSRLRITLSSQHTDEEIELLLKSLRSLDLKRIVPSETPPDSA